MNKLLTSICASGVVIVALSVFIYHQSKSSAIQKLFNQSQELSKSASVIASISDKELVTKIESINQRMLELLEADKSKNYTLKAYTYFKLGDNAKAIDLLNRAVQENPKDALAHVLLARIYRRSKEYDNALKELTVAQEFNKQKNISAMIFGGYGSIYLKLHQDEKALDYFQKATEFDDGDLGGWQDLMGIYFNRQNFEKVIEVGQKAIQHFPNDGYILISLAVAYDTFGRANEAITYFQKAYQNRNNLERNWQEILLTEMASAYVQLKDYKQAEYLDDEALKIDPTDDKALKIKSTLPVLQTLEIAKNGSDVNDLVPTPKSTICFKNGNCIDGIDVADEGTDYALLLPGGKMTFDKSQVASIKRGSATEINAYNKFHEIVNPAENKIREEENQANPPQQQEVDNDSGRFEGYIKDSYEYVEEANQIPLKSGVMNAETVQKALDLYSEAKELMQNALAIAKNDDERNRVQNVLVAIQHDAENLNNIRYKLGRDIQEGIDSHKLVIGMTKDDVIRVVGKPTDRNRTENVNGDSEQWCYGNSCLYFEGDVYTGRN